MKFTDLFIKRPVLAIVVNLVILIAGLQSIRALSVRQYPRSDIAVVRVSTTYVGANADLVRGFITTPLERVIASADGIDFVESSSAQSLSTILVHLNLNYDTNAALTQIQAKVAQVRNDLPPEAEAPRIELEMADNQFAALYLSFSSPGLDQNQITDYLTRVVQPKLSAVTGVQRADILGARTFAMRIWLQAGEDGRPRHLAGGAAGGAGPQQLPVGARAHQGVDGLGQPRGQHRPAHARGVPPAGRQGAERRRRPARRDRGRRAGRRELRGGRPLQRRDGGLHGHLGPADGELAGSGRAGARRVAEHPGPAAGRHEARRALRRDGLHRGRHPRGAAHPDRDAPDRRPRHLPVPGIGAGGDHPGGRDSDLADRRRLPDARGRVHHQPADAAGDRAVGRARRGRRDRDGRERRAPPARRHGARPGGADRGPRAGRADHRDDDHARRRLRARRHPGRADRRALP